jgi:hypothetical protein
MYALADYRSTHGEVRERRAATVAIRPVYCQRAARVPWHPRLVVRCGKTRHYARAPGSVPSTFLSMMSAAGVPCVTRERTAAVSSAYLSPAAAAWSVL